MTVLQFTPEQWATVSEDAHVACFKEIRNRGLDRIDFALMVVEGEKPLTYVTCYEHDANTVYLQFGGKFPHDKGTMASFNGYKLMLGRLKEMGYVRGLTLIENTNTPMLRIASKVGWLISGMRMAEGKLLVEHTLNLGS